MKNDLFLCIVYANALLKRGMLMYMSPEIKIVLAYFYMNLKKNKLIVSPYYESFLAYRTNDLSYNVYLYELFYGMVVLNLDKLKVVPLRKLFKTKKDFKAFVTEIDRINLTN